MQGNTLISYYTVLFFNTVYEHFGTYMYEYH